MSISPKLKGFQGGQLPHPRRIKK